MHRKWWTLIAVSLAAFLLLIAVTITAVVLPQIQTELGMSFEGLQWVIDAYALTLAAFLLGAGSLADRYGRKRLFLIGILVFTLGSVIAALSWDPASLLGARAIQGAGGAILFSTAMSLLAANFHGKDRGIAFGVWGAVTGAGGALGPIIGGALSQSWLGWRGVFWVNVPLGILLLVLAVRTVSESRSPQAGKLDLAGLATLTGALAGIVYGIIRAGEHGWDGQVATSLVLGIALLAAFAVIETRVANPLFDLKLLRIPTFLGGSVAALAMNGTLYAMTVYFVLYLQNALGYSALIAGLQLLIPSGLGMVVSMVAGILSSRGVPARWLIGGGLALIAAGFATMTGLTVDSDWTHLLLGFALAGIGSGLVNPLLAETAVGVVHYQRSGMASGANTTFRQLGIALGTAVYGGIYTAALRDPGADSTRAAYANGMNTLFLVNALVALTAAVLTAALIRPKDFVHSTPPGS